MLSYRFALALALLQFYFIECIDNDNRNPTPDKEDSRAYCTKMVSDFRITPGKDFGTLPKSMHKEFKKARCFRFYGIPDPVPFPPPPPDFLLLEGANSSTIATDDEFRRACAEMSGYYIDKSKRPELKKTIFIVAVNYGYVSFLLNFACHMKRLGILFLPIAMDERAHKFLLQTELFKSVYMIRNTVDPRVAQFSEGKFNEIGCRKMEMVYGALLLGYDVIFSDLDIVILKDPIQHLFLKNADYTHSTNKGCGVKWVFNETMEGNTGFYAVRSNPKTIRTWDLTVRSCRSQNKYDDQTMFWLILRHNTHPPPLPLSTCPDRSHYLYGGGMSNVWTKDMAFWSPNIDTDISKSIVTCPLDNCLFSSGNLASFDAYERLKRFVSQERKSPVMIHANWLKGRAAKEGALQSRKGLWLLDQDGGDRASRHKVKASFTCLSNPPPPELTSRAAQGSN